MKRLSGLVLGMVALATSTAQAGWLDRLTASWQPQGEVMPAPGEIVYEDTGAAPLGGAAWGRPAAWTSRAWNAGLMSRSHVGSSNFHGGYGGWGAGHNWHQQYGYGCGARRWHLGWFHCLGPGLPCCGRKHGGFAKGCGCGGHKWLSGWWRWRKPTSGCGCGDGWGHEDHGYEASEEGTMTDPEAGEELPMDIAPPPPIPVPETETGFGLDRSARDQRPQWWRGYRQTNWSN